MSSIMTVDRRSLVPGTGVGEYSLQGLWVRFSVSPDGDQRQMSDCSFSILEKKMSLESALKQG